MREKRSLYIAVGMLIDCCYFSLKTKKKNGCILILQLCVEIDFSEGNLKIRGEKKIQTFFFLVLRRTKNDLLTEFNIKQRKKLDSLL